MYLTLPPIDTHTESTYVGAMTTDNGRDQLFLFDEPAIRFYFYKSLMAVWGQKQCSFLIHKHELATPRTLKLAMRKARSSAWVAPDHSINAADLALTALNDCSTQTVTTISKMSEIRE